MNIIYFLFICCKNENSENKTKSVKKETKSNLKTNLKEIKIDSIKMQAFDDIYFGTNVDYISSKTYQINDIDYNVNIRGSNSKGKLNYFKLRSEIKILTEKKARKIIEELKNTISKKYENYLKKNKTYYIKHTDEKGKDEVLFDEEIKLKYDNNLIGLPYKYVGYEWDLPYKKIEIHYLISNKNKTRDLIYPEPNEDTHYIIYIEFRSKLLIDKVKSKIKEKDTNKF